MSPATDRFPPPNAPLGQPSTLTRETLADRLTTELRQQIVSGRLAPGDLMPTERELGEAFGVGRTTVREALHGLIAIGVVERRSGALFVSDRRGLPDDADDVAALAARISIRDVFETRKAIEGKAVELAAHQRDDADLARMRAALARMRDASGSDFHSADIEFHVAVVQASKNVVLMQVYEDSKALFFKLPAFWRGLGGRQRPRSTAGWEGHSSVADAIERRDAATAVRITCDLLDWASSNLAEDLEAASGSGSSGLHN